MFLSLAMDLLRREKTALLDVAALFGSHCLCPPVSDWWGNYRRQSLSPRIRNHPESHGAGTEDDRDGVDTIGRQNIPGWAPKLATSKHPFSIGSPLVPHAPPSTGAPL
jgi:hypothetical protein